MRANINQFRTYYYLVKPGIVRGNALMAAAGFLFALNGDFDLSAFLALTIGTSLIISCACVLNNVIDRDIDAKMDRTRKRAMVQNTISIRAALLFGIVLGVIGFALLVLYTNNLTVMLGVLALVAYVGLYTPIKRLSVHGTLVGSISGAIPPMAGYTAATNSFDGATILLGLLLVFWQMPHFYAIAMFRGKDYKSANIPVLPLVKGVRAARTQIIAYTILFGLTTVCFTLFEYSGFTIAIVGLFLTAIWLKKGLANYTNDVAWARDMFGWSLITLLTITAVLAFNSILP